MNAAPARLSAPQSAKLKRVKITNVAFIGAGQFARLFHFSTLSRMDDVNICAIAELDEELLHQTADRYDVPARYTDYRAMLKREDIDAVYVIMPPQPLLPIAIDVMRAGKPIFTEKPAGINTAQTRELARVARETGVKSCVGVNRRYCAILRHARREVEKSGPISSVAVEFHKDMKAETFGISILHAHLLHSIDPLRWLLGEVTDVCAHADHWGSKAGWDNSYNVFHALMRFEGGANAMFWAHCRAGGRYERFEIHGDEVSAYVRAPDEVEIHRAGQPIEIVTGRDLTGSDDMLDTYGYFTENREFIDAIRENRMPETHFGDMVKTMELCDRINAGSHVERLR